MKVDFANLKLAYQDHKDEFEAAMLDLGASAGYIMGPKVKDLEKGLKDFTGAKHAISCSSGTDALLIAMMALDIKPGDEIITTPFTFIATAETIAFLGAVPVFVDINEKSYNIDASKIEDKISNKTRAIIPVSLYGQIADMSTINSIAQKHNLPVIEDAAQSFGATYNSKKSCNLSTIGCTSFFPAKPLGCFGDGGAIFTSDDELANKMSSLRLHGQTKRYYHQYIGMGGRLDAMQAAILNIKLKYYDKDIQERQRVAKTYTSLLSNDIIKPIIAPNKTSVWAQYSIRTQNREGIQQKLKEKGIPTAIHYPLPLHLQDCFSYLNYVKGDFPISEKVANEIFSLPMNPYLTTQEIEYIADNLNTYL